MSFIIALIMWIYSWESRPEVKPWPPEPSKYKALFAEYGTLPVVNGGTTNQTKK